MKRRGQREWTNFTNETTYSKTGPRVCVFQEEGCVCMRVMFGFPLGLQAERVREVPQEQQERSWLYFDNNNKVVLPHSLSFFFFIQLWHNVHCRSRLIHERSLLCFSFPPTLLFEEFDAQRNRRVEKKKKTLEIGALCPNWTSVR